MALWVVVLVQRRWLARDLGPSAEDAPAVKPKRNDAVTCICSQRLPAMHPLGWGVQVVVEFMQQLQVRYRTANSSVFVQHVVLYALSSPCSNMEATGLGFNGLVYSRAPEYLVKTVKIRRRRAGAGDMHACKRKRARRRPVSGSGPPAPLPLPVSLSYPA